MEEMKNGRVDKWYGKQLPYNCIVMLGLQDGQMVMPNERIRLSPTGLTIRLIFARFFFFSVVLQSFAKTSYKYCRRFCKICENFKKTSKIQING